MNTRDVAFEQGRDEAKYQGYGDRRADVYAESFAATMLGTGDFWPTTDEWWKTTVYDHEQEFAIFLAVRNACRSTGTPAERWAIVERALAVEAHKLADDEAERS